MGDFNLPAIDWKAKTIKPGAPQSNLHKDFLDIIEEHSLIQLVSKATHIKGNVLDLILTNNDDLITNVDITPGISYHYCISCKIKRSLNMENRATTEPSAKPFYLFKTANLNEIAKDLTRTHQTLTELGDQNRNIDEIWNTFKKELLDSANKNILRTT